MAEIFQREQEIYDAAVLHLEKRRNGEDFPVELHEQLVNEYGNLLEELRFLAQISDAAIENLNSSNVDLHGKAYLDVLTGIYNRRSMEERLNREISSLSRSESGLLSVLMMDIDFFKRFNDTYGHGAGDDCLKAVAGTFNKCITRIDDFAARYGGEEFVVVLPNTNERGAHKIAQKIMQRVCDLKIPHEKNDASPFVTISIGSTTGRVSHTHKGTDFTNRADEALYISKKNGRNRHMHLDMPE
ncbi:MAG: GGDEF domain-containing protein [Defluviitaleaceae bacterium]|nr:GGDEF domain-containing protein [Defluviitaleaceae bacterium]